MRNVGIGVLVIVIVCVIGAFWMLHPTEVGQRLVERPGFLWRIQSEESCEGCHQKIDSGMNKQWRESVHFQVNVGCADCHGEDHEAVFAAKGQVSAGVCGKCHEKEVVAFAESGHADAELAALSDARFLAQSPAMQEVGCMGCHSIGARFADGIRRTTGTFLTAGHHEYRLAHRRLTPARSLPA